jgi:hypothetical protein
LKASQKRHQDDMEQMSRRLQSTNSETEQALQQASIF